MKKKLFRGFFLLSLSLFSGCQVPQVPESAKVSSYTGSNSTTTNNTATATIQNLPENQRLACEYIYCMAHVQDKTLASDKDCKASKDKLDEILSKYDDFSQAQNQARRDFIKMCPNPSFIGSPFK